MAVGYLDPNGDVGTNNWYPSVPGTHYTCVDGGVRSPDAPSTDDIFAGDGYENLTDIMYVSDLADCDEATTITIYCYGRATAGEQATVDIYINGGWLGAKTCMGTAWAWNAAATWNGSWTQAQINAMQVKFIADSNYGAIDYSRVRAFYVAVTYTPVVPSGWGHEFNGVVGASIAEISGVAIGNIASVKGVDI